MTNACMNLVWLRLDRAESKSARSAPARPYERLYMRAKTAHSQTMKRLSLALLFAFLAKGLYEFWQPSYGTTSWTMPFPPHWHIGGVFLTGVGAFLVGVVLMIIYRFVNPPFFKGQTLTRDTPVLAPEPDAAEVSMTHF